MSADGREFLVIVLGALAIIWGVIAMWNILERDREEREDREFAQRIARRYGPDRR